jgi:2-hydroxy-3-oxopropionate reductase
VDELFASGASAAGSPAAVAEASNVVFTNLPDTPNVESVVLGPDGILAGCRSGMLFIDKSTIKPETARQIYAALSEKGVEALDAPVSGGDIGAKAGTLAIMVGGPYHAFERAQPIYEAIGKTITYVSESGAGQVAKA